jgi:PAS domain S-box-containing protein
MHDGTQLFNAVLRMGELIGGARDVATTVDTIVRAEPLISIGAHGAAIFLADHEKKTLMLAGRRDGDESAVKTSRLLPIDDAHVVSRAVLNGNVELDEGLRILAVPLQIGADTLGALEIDQAELWRPDADELVALKCLGNLIALALSHAQGRERAQQLRSKIATIREASDAIANALAVLPELHLRAAVARDFRLWPNVREEALPEFLRNVLQTIVDHAVRATSAQLGALGFGDSTAQPFDPWVFTGISKEQADVIGRHPRPVGTLGLVAREDQTVRTSDVRKHPAFQGLPAHHPEVTSLLGVPIRYRGVNVGNLYLANKTNGQVDFSAEDQDVVKLLASQAAISLQQAYFRASIDAQRGQLQIILDSAPHGLLFVDARSGEVVANPRAMQLFGRPLPPEEGRDQYLQQIRRPDGHTLRSDELPSSRALAGQKIVGEEYVIEQADGRRVPVLGGAAPILGLDNKVTGAVVTFEDISSLKDLERLREEFAAVVAHDLRDPIQGILFQVDLMRRGAEDDMVCVPISLVNRLEQNARRLGQMTNDLLDATRIELKRVALDCKPVDMASAVRDLVERIRPVLGRHPVEVTAPPGVTVPVDPLRFNQILTNLLDNAAKFSPDEEPIGVTVLPSDGGIDVAIEDRGIGIPSEDVSRLYDRFYQSRRARERKSGLGLGLYITKGLVEAHGGRIWLATQPAKGSTFHVWFPADVKRR